MKNIYKILSLGFALLFVLLVNTNVNAQENGWAVVEGNSYYYNENETLKGIHEIDGKYYHFGENSGQLKTGWSKLLDGREYYANDKGELQFEWINYNGVKYYITLDEGTKRGIHEIDGKYYHFGENSGQLKIGWSKLLDGKSYYSDAKGELQFEWINESGKKYYITREEGTKRGIHEIDGNYYHFGENSGQLKIGWSKLLDGRAYYSNTKGELQFEWINESGEKYYITREEGTKRGIHEIDGKYYHFGENSGQLKIGISKLLDGRIYCSNADGELQFEWVRNKGVYYYITRETGAYRGIKEVEGHLYHFGENSGQLKIGWSRLLDGKIYYSDGYGILQKGDLYIDNNWYSFNDDYTLKTGWQTINGKTYYFYSDGTKARYFAKIAGIRYEFSTEGELQHSNIKIIADLSFHNGDIDWDTLWSSGEIDGVILRIGYSLGMDRMFTTYLSEANRLGVPYSVYHFSIAENSYEAQNEADKLVNWYTSNSLYPTYGVFYDIEGWKNPEDGHTSDGISVSDYDNIIRTYKTTLNNNGIYMSLYTGKNYAETRLSDYGREQIGWIAHYATDCGYQGSYRGWQYTSKGRLPGVNGDVDLSVFYY